jgi:hypothetical protein
MIHTDGISRSRGRISQRDITSTEVLCGVSPSLPPGSLKSRKEFDRLAGSIYVADGLRAHQNGQRDLEARSASGRRACSYIAAVQPGGAPAYGKTEAYARDAVLRIATL